MLRVTAPQGVSLDYTASKMREIEERTASLRDSGEVVGTFSIAGTSGDNSGFMIFTLAPWGERERDQQAIVDEVLREASAVVGLRSFAIQSNSLGIRGAGQGLQFALVGSSFDALDTAAEALVREMEADPWYRPGARLLRDDAAPALHQGRPRARVRPRHRHRRPRRDAAGGARRPLGRLGLRRRPQLRHRHHLDDEPGPRPDRPREPVPAHAQSARWCRCRPSSP